MLKAGEIHVWRVRLTQGTALAPTAGEAARAARLALPVLKRRYLRAHAALRVILGSVVEAPLEFALHEKGKPFLASAPEIRFNLSRSRDIALVAVARDVEIGVDIERLRPLPQYASIAERYFPAGYTVPRSVRAFFRQWTQFEAVLKAHGAGLYGVGVAPSGEWSVWQLDLGDRYVAAVAVEGSRLPVIFHEYREDETF